jgi:hypothetical protein
MRASPTVAPQLDAHANYHGNVSSGSWSHTIGSNVNAIYVFLNRTTTSAITATCKVGTTSMTLISSSANLLVWVLYNPPTGAQTVQFTLSTTISVSAVSASFIGMGATGTPSTVAGSGTALSQSAAAPMLNGTVLQAFGMQGGASSMSGYSQTLIDYVPGVGSVSNPIMVGYGSGTFTANSAANQPWGAVAVPVAPV